MPSAWRRQGKGSRPSLGWGHPRVPPRVSLCLGKAGTSGRAQETGSLGRSLYFRRSNSGSGWLQASPTALWSPSTPWCRNALLWQSPSAAPTLLSPGLDFPGAGPGEPVMLCRAGLTPNTGPGYPQHSRWDPVAGWGHASAGAAGCSEVAEHQGWHRGAEGLPLCPPPQPRRCRGWGWWVPMGSLGQEGGSATLSIPFSGNVGLCWDQRGVTQKRTLTARAGVGVLQGWGSPAAPRSRQPVSANKVYIIKAGGFGLAASVPPSLGGAARLGEAPGGAGDFGGARQCLGGAAGRGQDRLSLVASSPVTKGRRASWAWPGQG